MWGGRGVPCHCRGRPSSQPQARARSLFLWGSVLGSFGAKAWVWGAARTPEARQRSGDRWCCRHRSPGPSGPWPSSSCHPTRRGHPGTAPATQLGTARTGWRVGLWARGQLHLAWLGLGPPPAQQSRGALLDSGSLSVATADTGVREVPDVGLAPSCGHAGGSAEGPLVPALVHRSLGAWPEVRPGRACRMEAAALTRWMGAPRPGLTGLFRSLSCRS